MLVTSRLKPEPMREAWLSKMQGGDAHVAARETMMTPSWLQLSTQTLSGSFHLKTSAKAGRLLVLLQLNLL